MTLASIHKTCAAYCAATYLYKFGPMPIAELYTQVEFPAQESHRRRLISSAIASGWLIETLRGMDISDEARAHFAARLTQETAAPMAKHIGQKAGPRVALTPLYGAPPLSAKYRTNSRGSDVREIDERFQREAGFTHYSVPTGDAK